MIKLALPLVEVQKRMTSGYGLRVPLITCNWDAYEAANRAAAIPRRTDTAMEGSLARVYTDISGLQAQTGLRLNAPNDLVCLTDPCPRSNFLDFEICLESIFWGNDTPGEDLNEDVYEDNIRRVALPWWISNYGRSCSGCTKLELHHEQMKRLAKRRKREKELRRELGVKPKCKCKMCSGVAKHMQHAAGSEGVEESRIRDRLLEERKQRMAREGKEKVAAILRQGEVHVDNILPDDLELPRIRYGLDQHSPPESNLDDVVSVCSADIDEDDDFEVFNNSQEFFLVEAIPHIDLAEYCASSAPEESVQLPLPPMIIKPDDVPGICHHDLPGALAANAALATTIDADLPRLSKHNFGVFPMYRPLEVCRDRPTLPCNEPQPKPIHGTRTQCNTISIPDHEERLFFRLVLPTYLRDLESI